MTEIVLEPVEELDCSRLQEDKRCKSLASLCLSGVQHRKPLKHNLSLGDCTKHALIKVKVSVSEVARLQLVEVFERQKQY